MDDGCTKVLPPLSMAGLVLTNRSREISEASLLKGTCVGEVERGVSMLRISSNLASLSAQRALGQTQKNTEQALREVATGTRFTSAGSDAAGYAISENLRSQIQGYKAARYNADNAVSFVDVAEGAMQEQNNILVRLRELAVQAASDTFSDRERKMLNTEYQGLTQELDRIAKTTKFGSQPLLDGTVKDYEFQVGISKDDDNIIRYKSEADTTLSTLGLDGSSVDDKSDARSSLKDIDEALYKLAEARASLGAIHSRVENTVDHIDSQVEGLSTAYSKMSDADLADSVANARKGQILQQYQAAALNYANESQGYLLRLIA
jgi:flagellin